MHTLKRSLSAAVLVAVGYALGISGMLSPPASHAQEEPITNAQDETTLKVRAATNALHEAMSALESSNRYRSAIIGLNTFAISVGGGIDAIADLESGRGVDPETFAGLYAGQAIDEVSEHLDRDEEGRLRYKSKVIQLYPISRLKSMFAARARISAADQQ